VGDVYAEPLSFNGSIFVATEGDLLYSINAANGAMNWYLHVGEPANSTIAPYACSGGEPSVTPQIGITGTPVIDAATSTIYLVAMNNTVGYNLFAINTNNGAIRWSAPVNATGFSPIPEEQRGALTLADGFIYMPFGSFSWSCGEDGGPFGWMIGLSANGNSTEYSFRTNNYSEADIWTPEGASIGSNGNLYVVSGNSYYNATYNNADAVIELTPHLAEVSYFAPTNWAFLGPNDLDQDTTGATQLPGNLIFSIGKLGVGFILNASDLGGIGGQLYSASICSGGAWGSTIYADGNVYIPCASGLHVVSIHAGAHPTFSSLWNFTDIFAGPPIYADGAIWTLNVSNGTLYALNPQTGALIAKMSMGTVEHFTTPSIGGGYLIVAADETVYGLSVKG
jgi:outer membrane protein assembly factor BamB